MLYYVKPYGPLGWVATLGQEVIDLAEATDKDLGTLGDWWEVSDRSATDDDVRVAIRYGSAVSGGIVVDGGYIVTAQRPHELARLAAENVVRTAAYNELPTVRAVDDYMEAVAPGWIQYGVDLDERVAESLRNSAREAEAEAAEEIAAVAPRDDLMRHWVSLGGRLPDPR